MLKACPGPLAQGYDFTALDLDGVVYVGETVLQSEESVSLGPQVGFHHQQRLANAGPSGSQAARTVGAGG